MSSSQQQQQQQQQQHNQQPGVKLRGPIFSLTHGSGPLPLEGHQDSLVKVWNQLSSKIITPSRPDAIVVISAHFHSQTPKVLVPKPGSKHFTLKFDYTGMPPECYSYQFAPRGSTTVARAIYEEMKKMPILADAEIDDSGCVDHGVWVPMMKMLPTRHGDDFSTSSSSAMNSRRTSLSNNNNNNYPLPLSSATSLSSGQFGANHHHNHHSIASKSSRANSVASSTSHPAHQQQQQHYSTSASSFGGWSQASRAASSASAAMMMMRSSSARSSSTSTSRNSKSKSTSLPPCLEYCDIPIVPVSVSSNSDPAVQLAIGEAIRNALSKPFASSSSTRSPSVVVVKDETNNSEPTAINKKPTALGEKQVNAHHTTTTKTVSISCPPAADEKGRRSSSATTTNNNNKLPNVCVVGSGSINHNFRKQLLFPDRMHEKQLKLEKQNGNFNENLKNILSDTSLSCQERKEKMLKWRSIPGNSLYQPVKPGKYGSSDHFMPLLSVVAASGYEPITASLSYDYFGMPCSDFIWK